MREKRSTSLFNLFCSNVAKHVACFCWLLHRSFRQNRELKQQRRRRRQRRRRKRHLKSEFALLQTQSRLIHLVQFGKCWQIILEFKSQGLFCSSRKEKESPCLVSTYAFSEKRETGKFHVVVVQWRQRNVQKLGVKYGQSCCFANLNLWKVWTQNSFQKYVEFDRPGERSPEYWQTTNNVATSLTN